MSMLSENLRYLYECSELCDSFHVKNSLQYLPIETVGSDQVSNSTCSLGFFENFHFVLFTILLYVQCLLNMEHVCLYNISLFTSII